MTETEREPDVDVEQIESGFELGGRFYRWSITDTGKDLLLIDRFTGLPVDEFFRNIEDEAERGRAPMILAMVATSLRAGNPDWSVERIVRLVLDTPLMSIAFLDAETEVDVPIPPAEGGATPPSSLSLVDESSLSSTPVGESDSENSYAIPV